MELGFIGLGQMGSEMVGRLLAHGHAVVVWNRSPEAARRLAERGARVARSASETLEPGLTLTMLGDDRACREVWLDAGLPSRMPAAGLHLNMASVGLDTARALAAAHRDAGSAYVAAPVFGRPAAAGSGGLDIVAAGDPQAVARCVPLFEALGRQWFDVGSEPSQANAVKIARNFLLGCIVESLGEAFALAETSGVDPRALHRILTSTSLGCPAYVNYGRLILDPPEQPTFPLRLGQKDIEIALAAGGATGLPMPLARLLLEEHREAIAEGYGERDWAGLANWIAERARRSRTR